MTAPAEEGASGKDGKDGDGGACGQYESSIVRRADRHDLISL
jgi:hypothetical protein